MANEHTWGERSCDIPDTVQSKDGSCGIATKTVCNVDCPHYKWDGVTLPDSQPKLMEQSAGRDSRKLRRQFKLGRNDPCPCGSGKKSKKCCKLDQPPPTIISRTKKIYQAGVDVNK